MVLQLTPPSVVQGKPRSRFPEDILEDKDAMLQLEARIAQLLRVGSIYLVGSGNERYLNGAQLLGARTLHQGLFPSGGHTEAQCTDACAPRRMGLSP